ncbi:MAG: hypothetical protein LBC18_01385, partial [Opitutaceae bacterium]|nr:hypothetical protein [Opitutaceae bacterium]
MNRIRGKRRLLFFVIASPGARRIHWAALFAMAFNLQKVLRALLFSSSQPLSVKDIQNLFARFHEQAPPARPEDEDEENPVAASAGEVPAAGEAPAAAETSAAAEAPADATGAGDADAGQDGVSGDENEDTDEILSDGSDQAGGDQAGGSDQAGDGSGGDAN